MHPRRTFIASLLLVAGLASAGTGCVDRSSQEHDSKKPPAADSFVAMGPVTTEEEALATVWRYMEAHYDLYLKPPRITRDTVNGVVRDVYEDISPATINQGQAPFVWADSTRWGVSWMLRDGGIPGEVAFVVDKVGGQVEVAGGM
jgi:hypothetical protein